MGLQHFVMKRMQKREDGAGTMPTPKAERQYLAKARESHESGETIYIASSPHSPTNGFEMLASKEAEMFEFPEEIRMISFRTIKYMIQMLRSRGRSFKKLVQNEDVVEIEVLENGNQELWEELKEYASEKWGIKKIGFTRIPPEFIFSGKFISYPYALVFIEEMRKDPIDKAPEHAAGVETMRVYWHLGNAVNDIARWLRKKGIKCQPNHPLDGLTVTPPLAGKAGLGWQSQFGLLITPEFGVRQRIAPIFIDKQHFKITDSLEHEWIEEYCSTCGICIEECPTEAINEKRVPYLEGIETIGALKSCIDRPKCYPYFLETTGCSVCVKVCPFSRGGGVYDELKSQFLKKK